MPYTPPAGDAVNFTWQGATSYTAPAGDAVGFSFLQSVSGSFSGAIAVSGSFAGSVEVDTVTGSFSGSVAVYGELLGGHGVAATAAAQILPSGAFAGNVGTAGVFAGDVPLSGSFIGVHPLYLVSGEVREGGILVNRRVRVYHRATGALLAEADTTVGSFAIPVGFAEIEAYILPIHLDADAVDFAPPCANRVLAVMAGA